MQHYIFLSKNIFLANYVEDSFFPRRSIRNSFTALLQHEEVLSTFFFKEVVGVVGRTSVSSLHLMSNKVLIHLLLNKTYFTALTLWLRYKFY